MTAPPLVALRSRRHIAPFSVERPATVREALAARGAPGRSAYLAGGTDLIDWLKHGHVLDRVIRLDGIPELATIDGDPVLLRIGAGATHAAIGDSLLLRDLLPDLPLLWQGIANPRVRFTGTIGGNVMSGHSEYDGAPALMALGAEAERATEAGVERVPLAALAQAGAGLLTSFRVQEPCSRRLYNDRSLRPALAIWLGVTASQGRASLLRIGVGMAHPAPVGASLAVDCPVLDLGRDAAALAEALAALLPEPTSDGRASAGYRRRMLRVLARRILVRAGSAA